MTKKPKILILDDDELHRGLLGDGLEDYYDFEIARAEGIASAEEILKTYHPDLFLLDVVLHKEKFKVIQWVENLRRTPKYRHIPVLFVTAQGNMKEHVERLERTDFLGKPFTFEDVVIKIRALLSLAKE